MVQENHIDKALAFMESLEKLGNQLKAAEEHQKQLIARMLDLKKENLTDGEEYAELSQKSKSLQDIIDKWRPIYLERIEMVKSVSIQKRKRNNKKGVLKGHQKIMIPLGSIMLVAFGIVGGLQVYLLYL